MSDNASTLENAPNPDDSGHSQELERGTYEIIRNRLDTLSAGKP